MKVFMFVNAANNVLLCGTNSNNFYKIPAETHREDKTIHP